MSYTALARKYRPRRLSELLGQENLVSTLTNAIELNRVYHAFIFTGTRGVGKTTTARIMALSLNCTGLDGTGLETIHPCLECKNCQDILNFRHPDVIEIDAASNTGVDFAREIIDSSKYPPMIGRYKIFIIDEVHMLSKSAFNALLKTLEEPHSFIKFIFATTEYSKIPITIVSRCQKFFLQNLNQEELAKNLRVIAEKEGIKFDEEAIEYISKMAKGSVRDSLSIMDQAISLSDDMSLRREVISKMVSVSGSDYASDILKNIFENNVEKALETAENSLQSGYGVKILLSDLVDLIAKMMHSICTKTQDAQASPLIALLEKSGNLSIQTLDRMYQVISQSIGFANSIQEKSVIDTLVVRLSFISKAPSLEEIVGSLIESNG